MQTILRNEHGSLMASAMPGAVVFAILLLLMGMLAIMLFGFSSERVRRLEDKESAKAAFHALGLRVMADTTLVLDDTFKEYKPFESDGKHIEARIVMHGLYGLLEMRRKSTCGMAETVTKMIGTKVLPFNTGLLVPSSDAGHMSLGMDCRFDQPVLLPRGIYREIRGKKSSGHSASFEVHSSPGRLPDLSQEAMATVKRIYEECCTGDRAAVLDSRDSVPDLIVAAAVVKVDSSFCNSVQIFAKDSVLISSGAVLRHPSGIFVGSSKGYVMIDSCAVVEGYVVIKDLNADEAQVSGNHVALCLNRSSCMRGLVYVDGTAQLNGHVTGAAYVRMPLELTERGVSRMTTLQLIQTENKGFAYPLIFESRLAKQIIKEYDTSF